MKDLYLLSGLGADKRVFHFLNLGENHIHHIHWICPLKNESLTEYAGRLCQHIKSATPILTGVFFGGMVAIEIGKIIKAEKIILISSARTKKISRFSLNSRENKSDITAFLHPFKESIILSFPGSSVQSPNQKKITHCYTQRY